MDELFDDILVAIDTSPTAYVAQLEMMLEDETFASETFRASKVRFASTTPNTLL